MLTSQMTKLNSCKFLRNIASFESPFPILPSCSTAHQKRWNTSESLQNPNDSEDTLTEDVIEQKRNKSNLRVWHRRRVLKMPPQLEDHDINIMPLWQYRKLYGRFGASSGVDVEKLWPSEVEMELQKEREAVEFPHSVTKMIEIAHQLKRDEHEATMNRQNAILKNMKNLESWKSEVQGRIDKRETAAQAALAEKQKQIEEVRKIIGFQIDSHDPLFAEALEKKQEEDRKRAKKERKLKKQQNELERLQTLALKDASTAVGIGNPILSGSEVKNSTTDEPVDGSKKDR